MPTHELPARPNFEHLKKQAKLLLRGFLRNDPAATERFRAVDGALSVSACKLHDAQFVIAREYGFASWAELKVHVEASSVDPVEALTAAVKANDAMRVRQVLTQHPSLKSRLNEPLPKYGFDAPALFAAVNHGNREMIDTLLAAGADIHARTKWWAGSFGVLDSCNAELAEYLIKRGADVDIHAAARLGKFERVQQLISAEPALLEALGGDGQRPLHFAATVEIAGYLLDRGAEIDARDIDHESTAAQYMTALHPRRPQVARYLLSRGATSDLLMAAALGDLQLARKHPDANPSSIRISVSEEDFPKQNPRSGGSIYIYTFGWGKTPHMLAYDAGHTEVFHLLMERSPGELQLLQACEMGDETLVQQILARWPNLLETLPPSEYRHLVNAASRNNLRTVHMLLAAHWPPDARGNHQQTALHWAAWHGNAEMVRELLRHNAPLEAREQSFNGTPVDWALHGSQHGVQNAAADYAGSLEALLAAGAAVPVLSDDLAASGEALAVLRRHIV